MNGSDLTPDARAALVRIIRRAAQRGRELREQAKTANGLRVSEAHDPMAASAPSPTWARAHGNCSK